MKYIVDGKTYNTETAKEICHYWNGLGNSNFRNCSFTLYQTKKGSFFIVGNGGPMSRFSHSNGNTTSGGSGIEVWSIEETKAFCEKEMSAEDYITVFGEPEEA